MHNMSGAESHHATSIDTANRCVYLDTVGANLSTESKNMSFKISVSGPDACVQIGVQVDSSYTSGIELYPPRGGICKSSESRTRNSLCLKVDCVNCRTSYRCFTAPSSDDFLS